MIAAGAENQHKHRRSNFYAAISVQNHDHSVALKVRKFKTHIAANQLYRYAKQTSTKFRVWIRTELHSYAKKQKKVYTRKDGILRVRMGTRRLSGPFNHVRNIKTHPVKLFHRFMSGLSPSIKIALRHSQFNTAFYTPVSACTLRGASSQVKIALARRRFRGVVTSVVGMRMSQSSPPLAPRFFKKHIEATGKLYIKYKMFSKSLMKMPKICVWSIDTLYFCYCFIVVFDGFRVFFDVFLLFSTFFSILGKNVRKLIKHIKQRTPQASPTSHFG